MTTPSYSVNVSNIGESTNEKQLQDFFSFCGKIDKVDFNATAKTAVVYFGNPSAAKTALMLNGGTLDGAKLEVTSETEHPDEDHTVPHPDGTPYHQSDKPRAGIVAEYLAKGYVLSDNILASAIDLDQKKGISSRFLSYFNSLDKTVGEKTLGRDQTVSGRVQTGLSSGMNQARTYDEQRGLSKSANDYYSKAISSPFGKRVFQFYTSTTKQIQDIHEEARRIADGHKHAHAPAPAPGATTEQPTTSAQPELPPYSAGEKGYQLDEKATVQ